MTIDSTALVISIVTTLLRFFFLSFNIQATLGYTWIVKSAKCRENFIQKNKINSTADSLVHFWHLVLMVNHAHCLTNRSASLFELPGLQPLFYHHAFG